MSSINKNLIIAIVLIILAGAGGFYGGIQYQKTQRSANGFGNGGFYRRYGQNNQNFSAVRGQIISNDTNSITVKMNDGSTAIVVFGNSTNINKAVSGTSADLKQGEQVMAIGTKNSDGSVTAQSIQLNPLMRQMMPAQPSQQ